MNYPVYPTYKESGVPWLGEVPEHWEVKRGRFVMQVNPSAPKLRALRDDSAVSFVPMEAVRENGGLLLDRTKLKVEGVSGYTEFQENDVLLAKITPCFENGKGSIASGLTNSVAYGTTELHVLRVLACLDNRFLFYVTISDVFRKLGESEMYGAGGQKRIPPEFCKDFLVALPALPEQTAIADFLNRETGRIDTLIEKKRRLIALLQEKRSTLISRTVTRGLPAEAAREFGLEPHTRFKDSGVEWLGEVPEGWEVKRGRFVMQVNPSAPKLRALRDDSEVSFVPMEAVREYGGLLLDRTKLKFEGVSGYTEFQENDVLLAKITPCFENGKGSIASGLTNSVAYGTTELHVLRVLACLDNRFLFYVTISDVFRELGESEMYGAGGQKRIPPEFCKDFLVALPALPEQTAIATYLDLKTAKIDKLTDKVEQAIERLQEYRTALITAAVTGKIDVRYAVDSAGPLGLAAEEAETYG